MRLSKFEYQLSTDLIAQHPKEKRDESRLMVLDKENRVIKDNLFKQIINYIKPGDTIIANNTKVFPARLHGRKDRTGAKIEVDDVEDDTLADDDIEDSDIEVDDVEDDALAVDESAEDEN